MQLDPGDTLVVVSDGLSEALNADGEEFGEDRLEAAQNDDSTVLILRTQAAQV